MPATELTAQLEVNRSVFITTIRPVYNEEEAREVIASVRTKYSDARHHCSAFIIHCTGATPIERSNDDGEPSGTAGKPMLEVLRGRNLTNIAAVVTRYFGGIKLGTGGLVRAYTDAVTTTLEGARLLQLSQVVRGTLETTPTVAARLMDLLPNISVSWGDPCVISIEADPAETNNLDTRIARFTHGTAQIIWGAPIDMFADSHNRVMPK